MSYVIDQDTGDIVIGGFQNGIGATPYQGLTDLKSINIGSIPGEAAVNFSTSLVSPTVVISGTTATFTGSVATFTYPVAGNGQLAFGQAVIFNTTVGNVVANTVYWVQFDSISGGLYNFKLYSDYKMTTQLTPSTTGTALLNTIEVGTPKFFQSMDYGSSGSNFMLDSNGRLWSDASTSGAPWRYMGNSRANGGNGNGLVYWRAVNSTKVGDWDGYLFFFRDGFIDYSNVNGVSNNAAYNHVGTFVYGWSPEAGTTGTTAAYLTGQNLAGCPHNGIVGPDGNLYFVDYYTTWKIQQTDIVTPVNFDPTDDSTYIVTHAHNLPINEISTCIAPFGTNFLIGGVGNQAYVWNGVDQLTITNPILLAEAYTAQIVTVNTNAYIFCGNRGNIYLTNGSQAKAWKKVPDHISNTTEPYFKWGGATYQKGSLYFGVYVTQNNGTAISGYGGVWQADVQTGALSLSNQLSYGTYDGYVSALYAIPSQFNVSSTLPSVPAGVGLFIGWVGNSALTTFGIDKTISTVYTGGQSIIVSDAIPIGTALQPTTSQQFEYKLAKPLLAGESVELQVGSYPGDTFTSIGTTTGDSSATILSGNFPSTVQQQQWLLLKAILTGKSSSPSYNRVTQLRIIGSTNKVTQSFSV